MRSDSTRGGTWAIGNGVAGEQVPTTWWARGALRRPSDGQGLKRCSEAAGGRSVPFRRGQRAALATFPAEADSLVPQATPPRRVPATLGIGVGRPEAAGRTVHNPALLTNFPRSASFPSTLTLRGRPNKSRRWPRLSIRTVHSRRRGAFSWLCSARCLADAARRGPPSFWGRRALPLPALPAPSLISRAFCLCRP
jgi:hypothetical protein